jgi:hypothetical protein
LIISTQRWPAGIFSRYLIVERVMKADCALNVNTSQSGGSAAVPPELPMSATGLLRVMSAGVGGDALSRGSSETTAGVVGSSETIVGVVGGEG